MSDIMISSWSSVQNKDCKINSSSFISPPPQASSFSNCLQQSSSHVSSHSRWNFKNSIRLTAIFSVSKLLTLPRAFLRSYLFHSITFVLSVSNFWLFVIPNVNIPETYQAPTMAALQNALLLACQSHKLAKPASAKPPPQPVSPVLSSSGLAKPFRAHLKPRRRPWHLSTLISTMSHLRGLTAPSDPAFCPHVLVSRVCFVCLGRWKAPQDQDQFLAPPPTPRQHDAATITGTQSIVVELASIEIHFGS